MLVGLAGLALLSSEKIPRVELHTRLGGHDSQPATAGIVEQEGRERQLLAFLGRIENEVMVVAQRGGIRQFSDAFANWRQLAEVERRSLDRCQFAGRDQRVVDGRVFVGMDAELMMVVRGASLSR